MVEKYTRGLREIQRNGGYKFGIVAALLSLPKMVTVNADGSTVPFKAEQNHIRYLWKSNQNPMKYILGRQRAIYGTIPMSDGREILIAAASSPYVVEGEHMILWALSGDNFRFQPNFNFISDEQGQKLFSTVANVVDIYMQKGLTPLVGINSNAEEYQRQSVQSIRDGVHVHCVGVDRKDIQHLEPIKEGEDARILNDPFARLSNRLLEKVVMPKVMAMEEAVEITKGVIPYKEYSYTYPKGISLVMRDGVNTLRRSEFFKFIKKIHQTLEAEYEELIACFTDSKPDTFRAYVDDDIDTISFFRRPMPLSKEEIYNRLENYFERHPELKGDKVVQGGLRYIAGVLKSASEVVKENSTGRDGKLNIPIVKAKIMNSKIIMQGLSYNMLIFHHPDTGELLLNFVPRVTTGGSPLDSIGIKKDQYSVSEEEFKVFIAEMDKRLDITVNEILRRDPNIVPGIALKGVPKARTNY